MYFCEILTREFFKLLSKNFRIIIFSAKCRPDRPLVNDKTGKQLVIEWLEQYDFMGHIFEVTHEKPRAMIYIDDKGYRFKSWCDTIRYLKGNL